MKKVVLFSILLVIGLALSQVLPFFLADLTAPVLKGIQILTMTCLGFIMIHVGYEFEIDRSRLSSYGWDYLVAATAAAFPWIFCTLYFVFFFYAPEQWGQGAVWKESLLAGRFAAPTSAGVLFSMMAAAGLSATWVFKKARILAIFDDLDTVLLMIPLKMLIVGIRWQLVVVVVIMGGLLWVGWKYLHRVRIPVSWPWVLGYSAAITAFSEALYQFSKILNDVVPIHIEILLPAFVVGVIMARPEGQNPHLDDQRNGHQEGPESPEEQKVSTLISAIFMVLVGLSMPSMFQDGAAPLPWGTLLFHVAIITVLSNLGKMFPLLTYRKETGWRERLAVSVAMFPRGEVGAGVLLISLSYGIDPRIVSVGMVSLALNLFLTGIFIAGVKALVALPKES